MRADALRPVQPLAQQSTVNVFFGVSAREVRLSLDRNEAVIIGCVPIASSMIRRLRVNTTRTPAKGSMR